MQRLRSDAYAWVSRLDGMLLGMVAGDSIFAAPRRTKAGSMGVDGDGRQKNARRPGEARRAGVWERIHSHSSRKSVAKVSSTAWGSTTEVTEFVGRVEGRRPCVEDSLLCRC